MNSNKYQYYCVWFCFIFFLDYQQVNALPKSVKPWLGVGIETHEKGVLVTRALPGAPAQKSGIKTGDIILSIDSHVMKTAAALNKMIQSLEVGQKVAVEIERTNKKSTLNIFLEVRPDLMSLIEKNEGKPAQPVNLTSIAGKTVNLNEMKGQVVLIKFWATWCPSCRASFPYLDNFIGKNKGKKLVILTVSNEDVSTQSAFFNGKKQNFIALVDPKGEASNAYMVPALPSYVLIDKNGLVSQTAVGSGSYLKSIPGKASKLLEDK
ncbi:MAG: redoxin family protein [Oligoflexales bacterium]